MAYFLIDIVVIMYRGPIYHIFFSFKTKKDALKPLGSQGQTGLSSIHIVRSL